MAGIRSRHAIPSRQKEAILPKDPVAMLETLGRGSLPGLRDRAMLLFGFAGGLRRSEIVGLDVGPDQSEDGRGPRAIRREDEAIGKLEEAGTEFLNVSDDVLAELQERLAFIEDDWVEAANERGIDGAAALAFYRSEIERIAAEMGVDN